MFDAAPIRTQPEFVDARLRAKTPQVVASVDPIASRARHRADRDAAIRSKRLTENVLDLIVHWDRPIAALERVIEGITDWGPFELTDAAPVAYRRDGRSRVFCRFQYHGSKADRDHYEWNLKVLLKEHAVWEDARASESAA